MAVHTTETGFEDTVSCSVGRPYEWAAQCWQKLLLLRGVPARDTANLACIRLIDCIKEIADEENKTREELQILVTNVRAMDVTRHKSELKNKIVRSRQLREGLNCICRKRQAMQHHLDTLRQSKINQSMLQSMKHTNDALQNLGLKVTDADTIMLDLEDSVQDASSLQTSLATPFDSNVTSEFDMEEELEVLLSEDPYALPTHETPRQSKRPELSSATQHPHDLPTVRDTLQNEGPDPPDDSVQPPTSTPQVETSAHAHKLTEPSCDTTSADAQIDGEQTDCMLEQSTDK